MLDTFFNNVGRKFMLRQGQDFATDGIDYLGFVLLKLKKNNNHKVKYVYVTALQMQVHLSTESFYTYRCRIVFLKME